MMHCGLVMDSLPVFLSMSKIVYSHNGDNGDNNGDNESDSLSVRVQIHRKIEVSDSISFNGVLKI